MDFQKIKHEAKSVLQGNRFMLLVILLVVSLIGSVLTATVIGIILTPILAAGTFFVIKHLLQKREVVAERLYNQITSINHAMKIALVGLLVQVIVMLGLCLLIVPGFIFALQYSQALRIIAENKDMEVMEALRRSKEMMIGHKWELFSFYLSFIGHFFLILITLGFYLFYFVPYFATCVDNYYLHLSGQAFENTSNLLEMDE